MSYAYQMINNPSVATTTDVERASVLLEKRDCSFVLLNAVTAREFVAIPPLRKLVIALGSFIWSHIDY